MICRQLAFYRSTRKLHLFDSFEGFPEPSAAEDLDAPHVQSGVWCGGGNRAAVSAHRLKKEMDPLSPYPDTVKIYPGWYRDTLPTLADDTKLAMLLMDCCLYRSHYEALSHVFQNEWSPREPSCSFPTGGRTARRRPSAPRRAWRQLVSELAIDFSDRGSYCWGGHSFIVHSYEGPCFLRLGAASMMNPTPKVTSSCRICRSLHLVGLVDLGEMPIAHKMLTEKTQKEASILWPCPCAEIAVSFKSSTRSIQRSSTSISIIALANGRNNLILKQRSRRYSVCWSREDL